MRCLFLLTLAGCGFQVGAGVGGGDDVVLPDAASDATPDAPPVRDVPPRIIAGGGVADGPIEGVLNVYAIDWLTGAPIKDATIDAGDTSGTTDATGLFVVRAPTLAGKQTVLATAAGYRAEEWIGVGGANVTLALHPLAQTVPHVDVGGTFGTFGAGLPSLPTGHARLGSVGYSSADGIADPYNNIKTAANANSCTGAGGVCSFTVSTRTGNVALIGTTYDYDPKSPNDPNDDTYTVQTYSYKTGLALTASTVNPTVTLTQIAPAQLANLSITAGTLPPGTTGFFVLAGVELPTDGTLYLAQYVTAATGMIKAPPLSLFPGAHYRIAGLAGHNGTLSVMVRHGLTGTALDGGAWLVEPILASANRFEATWTPSADSVLSGVLVKVAGTDGAEVLNVVSFDGTTAIAWPARVSLPPMMTVQATAQRGALDVADLSFARDGVKIDGTAFSAAAPAQ